MPGTPAIVMCVLLCVFQNMPLKYLNMIWLSLRMYIIRDTIVCSCGGTGRSRGSPKAPQRRIDGEIVPTALKLNYGVKPKIMELEFLCCKLPVKCFWKI